MLPSYLYHEPHITHLGRMVKLLDGVRELIKLPSNPLVLDAGCSTGISTYELASLIPGACVIGIDLKSPTEIARTNTFFAPHARTIAKLKGADPTLQDRVHFLVGNMYDRQFKDSTFHLIVMANNLLNIIYKNGLASLEVNKCIGSAIEMLVTGGYLILYSDSATAVLEQQRELSSSERRAYLIIKKTATGMELVGNESFYDYYSDFNYQFLAKLTACI